RPCTCELHDLSNHHEQFKRPNGIFADEFRTNCRLRETKRYTVTGISALHMSIHGMDGRSPSPRNSFKDLYLLTQAMIRRKCQTDFSDLDQDPIETNNSFSDLEQDVEHPPPTVKVTTEVVTPKITPPTL
ncbi:hypothetical protein TNCV_1351931, partial [Trichonephila clavipes]